MLVRRRTDRMLAFGFDLAGPALLGQLGRDGLWVASEFGGTCWDRLFDFDAVPERRDAGFA